MKRILKGVTASFSASLLWLATPVAGQEAEKVASAAADSIFDADSDGGAGQSVAESSDATDPDSVRIVQEQMDSMTSALRAELLSRNGAE